MMKICRVASLSLFLVAATSLFAGSVRLINNSPYDLRAAIRGSDGSYLGEVVIKAQNASVWTDAYGQTGTYSDNSQLESNYRSRTPYTVLWYCMDGGNYGVCDTVSTGAVVQAQGCGGNRMCKPQKKDVMPDSNAPGNFLYQPPKEQSP